MFKEMEDRKLGILTKNDYGNLESMIVDKKEGEVRKKSGDNVMVSTAFNIRLHCSIQRT